MKFSFAATGAMVVSLLVSPVVDAERGATGSFKVTTKHDLNLEYPLVLDVTSSSNRMLKKNLRQRRRALKGDKKGSASGDTSFIVYAEDDDNFFTALNGNVLAFNADDGNEAICTSETCFGELKADVTGKEEDGCAVLKIAIADPVSNSYQVVCPSVTQIATGEVLACSGENCPTVTFVTSPPWFVDISVDGASPPDTVNIIQVTCCEDPALGLSH